MRRAIVGILVGIAFAAAVGFATWDQIRVTCEVCMMYRGRQICEQAVSADRAQAMMHATTSACAQLSAGVTDGIQCNNTRPLSVQCSE